MKLGYESKTIHDLIPADIDEYVKQAINPLFYHMENLIDPWHIHGTTERIDKMMKANPLQYDSKNACYVGMKEYKPVSIWTDPAGEDVKIKYLNRVILDTDVYTPNCHSRIGTIFNHKTAGHVDDMPYRFDAYGNKQLDLIDPVESKNFYTSSLFMSDSAGMYRNAIDVGNLEMQLPMGMVKTCSFIDVSDNSLFFKIYGTAVNKILEDHGVTARWVCRAR